MIINVSVAVDRIIEECNIQTSLDFQAMRVQTGDAVNALYDDWIMTEDYSEPIYYALQDICSNMSVELRTIIKTYSAGREVISIDVEDSFADANASDVLEGLLRQYLKFSLLAWWYLYRNAELSARYSESAATAINNIFTSCIPRVGTIMGRYF